MNLRASGTSIVLPIEISNEIISRISSHWTGSLTLNFKEGEILAIETTEKKRIDRRETHESRDPRKGNSHGQQLPDQ